MPRVPEPGPTSAGPAYQGRVLPRPQDEVVDQGVGFDVGTLLSRRGLLGVLGVGVGAATLAACGALGGPARTSATAPTGATTSEGEIPEETNGPYPADGTAEENVLERSGIVRGDITTSLDDEVPVEGVGLALTLRVLDVAEDDAPFEGVAVYVWQCDAQGRYSMYSEGVETETFLRGVQVADAAGEVRFTTVVPGCYPGRWTHVHLEVYPDAASATDVENVIATSQIAFPPRMLADVYALPAYAGSSENLAGIGTTVADDGIFADGDWSLQVPEVTGEVGTGFTGSLTVRVDTSTEPSTGGAGGPGGAPPEGGRPGGA